MKTILIIAFLLIGFVSAEAFGPDTLWSRNFWYELNAAEPDYFEFHPINDSIFIFTSRGKETNSRI